MGSPSRRGTARDKAPPLSDGLQPSPLPPIDGAPCRLACSWQRVGLVALKGVDAASTERLSAAAPCPGQLHPGPRKPRRATPAGERPCSDAGGVEAAPEVMLALPARRVPFGSCAWCAHLPRYATHRTGSYWAFALCAGPASAITIDRSRRRVQNGAACVDERR